MASNNVPENDQLIMSLEAITKLEEELEELRTVKRQEVSARIAQARAFGISGRSPVPGEIADMDRWLKEYGFPMKIIEEAAARTIKQTGKPSFPYAERILSAWHEADVRRMADITALDEQHKTVQKEQHAAPAAKPRQSAGKFGNFAQRDDEEHRRLVQELIRNQ